MLFIRTQVKKILTKDKCLVNKIRVQVYICFKTNNYGVVVTDVGHKLLEVAMTNGLNTFIMGI